MSSTFIDVYDNAGAKARWMLLGKDVGSKVVDLSFFPDFVDEMRWILV
jgi:hypothetical protein